MKLPMLSWVTLISIGLFLGACHTEKTLPSSQDQTASAPRPAPPADGIDRSQVCRASYITPVGDFKTSAVDIPFGTAATAPHLRIGNVEYTHDEAQKLAPAAQEAEQVRLMYCLTTDPNLVARIPPEALPGLLMEGMHAMENLHGFTIRIINATSVQEAQQAANELKVATQNVTKDMIQKVKQYAPDVQVPKAPAPGVPNTAPPTPTVPPKPATAALPESFKSLFVEVSTLNKRLSEHGSRSEIKVLGFGVQAVSMPATERQQLYVQFQEALDKIPPNQRPIVFIVGYAEKSGSYLKNIDLGLRRAQTVMNFLQEQTFSRSYEGHVMSGGIDDGAYSRRVDIFLTGS